MKVGNLIIDGRNLLYRVSDAFRTLSTEIEGREIGVGGMYGFLSIALRVHQRYSGKVWVAWEGKRSRNFRRTLFPDYKKRGEPDPATLAFLTDMSEQEQRLRAILRAIGVRQYKGADCEADDVMARIVMDFCAKETCVVYTGDSDLRALSDGERVTVVAPGRQGKDTVYTPQVVREKHGVNPDQIADQKALAGDNSDGIPGLKSIGPKTAAELLNKYGTLKAVVHAAVSDDAGWPVAQRFKGVIAAGTAELELYRQLTGLREDAGVIEIERRRSKSAVLNHFAAYKFRSLLSPSDLVSIMNLGV
jgi:DNA polymerase-1